ncbi:hypothetical protein M2104_002875 [Paenibacillus sp. PastH-2]|nr:hypothetical protein [Paenibacillus sp. PastH-2]
MLSADTLMRYSADQLLGCWLPGYSTAPFSESAAYF